MTTFLQSLSLSLLGVVFLFGPLSARQSTPEDNATANDSSPKVERVGKGIYKVEEILLDKNRNLISFPAVTNQVSGLVEYAIVHEKGKIHEALFRTKVRPIRLQFVLLLAKHKPARGFIDNLWAEKPKPMDISSSKLGVFVSWDFNGSKGNHPLESFALNEKDDKPIDAGSFVFTGSKFFEKTFQAEATGSIVAVYADDTAMVNSADFDSNNDDVWYADKKAMPPLETPVTITLQIPAPKPNLKK